MCREASKVSALEERVLVLSFQKKNFGIFWKACVWYIYTYIINYIKRRVKRLLGSSLWIIFLDMLH